MTITTAHDEIGDMDALQRLERFGGRKLRDELTALFLAEAPARIEAARRALAAGDEPAVRATAHSLKSSAGQMGAVRIQRICDRLDNPDWPADAARAIADLDTELQRYRAWLATVSPREELP
jgi:HPt (histidine-containing phosphotransfer) domain-containing protein